MCKAFDRECEILKDDLTEIASNCAGFSNVFENKNVLITGATGLIGKALVKCFLMLNHVFNIKCSVIAHGRSILKLQHVFQEYKGNENLVLWSGELNHPETSPKPIHFVIHTACPTASKEFVEQPLEVIDSIYQGTLNILQLAKHHNAESVVYLSSMEVYGRFTSEMKVTEDILGELNIHNVRSSYPMTKRLAELLCVSSFHEWKVPVKIARLSMVFGPGVDSQDRRVLNYFIQQLKSKSPIQLQTTGQSKATVLYLRDAVEGILHLLVYGENGESYNLANPANYYSIYEMAKIAAAIEGLDVLIATGKQEGKNPYPNDTFLNLDIGKAIDLGWIPKVDLETIFKRVLKSQIGSN